MEPIQTGSLVQVRMGRDRGITAVVVGSVQHGDKTFCLIADGNVHRLENPKKKNPIHLQTMGDTDPTIAEAIGTDGLSDKLIRQVLRSHPFRV